MGEVFFFLISWFLTATSGTKPIIVSAGYVYILLHQREKRSTIQYGNRKLGTHARVFSQTLTHGNRNNEIRQWDRLRLTKERLEYGKKNTAGTNKRSPDGLSHPNRNTIIMDIIWKIFIRNGKVQWNSINKKQNGEGGWFFIFEYEVHFVFC